MISKKRLILIIIMLLFSSKVFASGVLPTTQSGGIIRPSNASTSPVQTPTVSTPSTTTTTTTTTSTTSSTLPSTKDVKQQAQNDLNSSDIAPIKPFNPIIEPIQKAPVTQKTLQATTTKDIPCYEKISLPKAIEYAMTHNLDIASTRLDTDIARNNVKVANRLKNPSVITFFNFGRAATDNPNYFGPVFPIEIAKRGPRKNLAKSTLELTKGNVLLAELTLRLDVRQAYVDLVATKSTLRILNDQRKLLQDLLYVAQKKYEAGAVAEMDVIQAKMTLNQILIQVNSANTNIYVARYKFNTLLDPYKCNFDTVEDYLPEQNEFVSLLTPKPYEKMPCFDDLLKIMLEKRVDIKNALRDIDVAKKNLVTVVRQRVPDFELGGGYMFVAPPLATDSQYSQGVYLMGNITNIPLLYQYTPEIKNAKLQVEQKELAYKSLVHDATLSLHSAYDSFNTSRDNLNYYNDILLSESKQFLKMAKRSYEVGKTNITDLIFIEQSYKNIMMSYVNALSSYYDAWVDVLREVNDEELKLNG